MRISLLEPYLVLLQNNRSYRYLWLSQVVSLTGDWFNLIAAASLVARLDGSGLAIGGLFLARLLPPFLLGPLAGVVADRVDRRKILIASDLLRALVVLGFLLVQSEQDVWLIYVLTTFQLSLSAFFEPARSALLPSLVRREDLLTANALDGITWSALLALGAALGGLATALFGATTAFVIDALTFVLSAWFVGQIRLFGTASTSETALPAEAGWQALVSGWQYLWQQPAVLVVALLKGGSALASGGMTVLEVSFAEEIFPLGNDGSGTLGLILFIAGLGATAGPLVVRRLTGDHLGAMYWTILAAFAASFTGYLLTGWAVSLPLLLLATFIRSAGGSTNWVYSNSMLQLLASDRLLGRVFAFDIAMFTLGAAISTLWVGWARDSLGLDLYQISLLLTLPPLLIAVGWSIYLGMRGKMVINYEATR